MNKNYAEKMTYIARIIGVIVMVIGIAIAFVINIKYQNRYELDALSEVNYGIGIATVFFSIVLGSTIWIVKFFLEPVSSSKSMALSGKKRSWT